MLLARCDLFERIKGEQTRPKVGTPENEARKTVRLLCYKRGRWERAYRTTQFTAQHCCASSETET